LSAGPANPALDVSRTPAGTDAGKPAGTTAHDTVRLVREPGADRLVPPPTTGRVHRSSRRTRIGDVSPEGRTRFDALARYLQDVADDDTTEAGLDDALAWVVRRTVVEVRRAARLGEVLDLATFCSGLGPRWAERRVSIRGDGGAAIEAATLWVRVDADSGRPLPVGDQFHELYAPAAGGRQVTARLQHPARPPDGAPRGEPWALRFVDLDLLGHVNNAASWAIVEQELARRPDLAAPHRAELEYRAPIEREHRIELARADTERRLEVWAVDAAGRGDAFLSARVERLSTG
jgi:acyl-ACP thioesterase